MPSAFDLIGHNPALQEHWIRRFFAFLIDGIIVTVLFLFLAIPFAFLTWAWFLPSFLWGAVWFGYSWMLETFFGGTVGKKILALRVVAIDRNLDIMHALIRNLSKIFPIVFLVDTLIGAATQGDPRQRLFDRMARTTVTRVDQGAYMEEQFRMMQHAGPYPMTMPRAPAPQAPPPAPGSPQAAAAPAGGWPQQPGGGWPGQAPTPGGWPQHQWDEQGRLVKEMKFCTACGGQLVARGDGKLTCVRCGAVY
ncbi:MAG: RDD family protein [Thermoplasmata archaeon]|nr:RDD family protein [Thermoplasmata archaeon]